MSQNIAIDARTPGHIGEFSFPEKPLLSLVPSRGWVAINLRELWSYRELLYFLTWRDITVRYKQTALGVIWAILQPLFPMLIFTLFFGRLAKVPSDGMPYAVFAYAGLLPWTFFANAIGNSSTSVVANANLISRVYFPRLIVPAASVLAALVDFAIAFLLLGGLLLWYRLPLRAAALLLFPLLFVLTLLSLGIGMLLSALTVKYRDVRFAIPFLIQAWMFVTPVIYPASLVPERWRWVLALNPMAGLVEGSRAALFNKPFAWNYIAYSATFSIAALLYSAFSFRRMERTFADVI